VRKEVGETFADLRFVDQGPPRGTGHAVQVALAELQDFDGDVLITYGADPLVRTETLAALVAMRGGDGGAPCSVLTGCVDDPTGYGRILRDDDGRFVGIREHRDCDEEELLIDEINVGFYCFDRRALAASIGDLGSDNAQGEIYLTDVPIGMARSGEVPTLQLEDPSEMQGVNTLAELAIARSLLQERIMLEHLDNGVMIIDPATTWIDAGVEIGADTVIRPCTVIAAGCRIGSGCDIGPFAHLRAGTVLDDGAEIGNFVEAKNSHLGARAKAKHLTYLGDATIGPRSNIGAGTITANYDGRNKSKTTIGERCFVGSGTVIVAPSTLADGAMTAAGAIVRRGSELGPDEVWAGVPARLLKRRDALGEPAAQPEPGKGEKER
ncbi:MAG: bifunctional N-acetylglucosamine-1-phosphate uridyltransferase/glucosamine-1-phosphate acetyltransferase, partial [Planctomycetes bacterium]|nr:bifunctional N-acetylglucosamine-1-phosphate uridyltransferase/glucosamine-1-phosphate acetyltransferase [Planctomycetota bacterium]